MHIEIAGVLMISWAVMTAVFGLLFYAIDIINRDLLYPRPVISKPRMFLGHLALGAIAPVIIIMFVWRAFRKMQTVNGCREELHEYFRARNSAPATNVIQPLLPTSSS